jgi:hypothetical protein
MRNGLILATAVIAFAAPAVENVRIDRPKSSASGTLLVTVNGRVLPVATGVAAAWPAMKDTAVLYTREKAPKEIQLRIFDAPSSLSRTIGTVPADVVDVIQDLLPDGHWRYILTLKDAATNVPSLAVVRDDRGVLYVEAFAAPGTFADGRLQVRRYTKEEIQRTRGDLMKAQPASVDPLALASLGN